ncbi:hypothetical protein ACQY0O_000548 [Thecaphora frezii]
MCAPRRPASPQRPSSDAAESESARSITTTTSPESQRLRDFSRSDQLALDPAPRPGPTKGTKGKAKYIPNRVKRYHERSLDGCLTCRKRRVKCDEIKPVCQRCACGDRECIYVTAASDSPPQGRTPHDASLSRPSISNENGQRSQPIGLQVSSLLHHPLANGADPKRESVGGDADRLAPQEPVKRLKEDPEPRGVSLYASTARAPVDRGVAIDPSRRGCYRVVSDATTNTGEPLAIRNLERSDASLANKLARTDSSSRGPVEFETAEPPAQGEALSPRLANLLTGYGFENIESCFSTFEEQSLFRHYIFEVTPQLCALKTPLANNPWIRHHAALAVQSSAAGSSGSSDFGDSLRSALLSIASFELGHRLSQPPTPIAMSRRSSASELTKHESLRWGSASSLHQVPPAVSGLAGPASVPVAAADPSSAASVVTSNVLLELSNRRREESLRLLRSAIRSRREQLRRSDAVLMLAAVLGLAARDRFAALPDWQEGLRIASRTIADFGGVAALVQTSDPASLFMVEQLASYEALASLTSEAQPLFLQPWSDWWYRLMATPRSMRKDGVLQTLGVPRGLVDTIARMTQVEATRRDLEIRTGRTIALSETIGASSATLSIEYEETRLWLHSTARVLATEIPVWSTVSFPTDADGAQHSTLPALMNQLYVAAAEIYLHAVIFRRPSTHPTIVRRTATVLDCCEEAIRSAHRYGLVLPLAFAAVSASQPERERILAMLVDLQHPCHPPSAKVIDCYEHLWRLADAGLGLPDCHIVLHRLSCFNWSR